MDGKSKEENPREMVLSNGGCTTLEGTSETLPASQCPRSNSHRNISDGSSPKLALVVYHHDGIETRPLLEGEPFSVGRGSTADIRIKDPSLSRHHARIELIDGDVYIEDLGSTNGTSVDGALIQRAKVKAGQRLSIGVVDMTIIRLVSPEAVQWGLDDHDRFLRELEVEVARSENLGRQTALMMVQVAPEKTTPLGTWFSQLTERLRPFDRSALYSTHTVEVLLVESGEERAREIFQHLEAREHLRCGIALYPQNAHSANGLVHAARSALLAADSTQSYRLADSGQGLLDVASEDSDASKPIMASAASKELFEMAESLASSTLPALIVGETGSGKEVVAQRLHILGPRRGRPMVILNCGALPAHLVKAQLFGQERGAFPGVDHRVAGVFERAHGGTLFLDEVGVLPASAQAALLRVIETGRIAPLGSATELSVDVRIIAATNRNLERLCQEGKFGTDLFFRLNALTIEVPPLRDRTEDIIPLAESFLTTAAQAARRKTPSISRSALHLLLSYPWPGNVRELRNTIERAVVIAKGDTISVEDLPERLRSLNTRETGYDERNRIGSTTGYSVADGGKTKGQQIDNPEESGTLKERMERYESALILQALHRAGANREAAADALGLPLRTLAHKMRSHGIRKGPKGRYEQS